MAGAEASTAMRVSGLILVSHALNEVANYVERIALVVEGGFRIGTVAEIFTESDRTELPGIIGVRHRSLYSLDDLYVHLVETDAGRDERP